MIAWANEPRHDDGQPAQMWDVHLAEIARQGAEWAELRARHPGVPLVVAGDLNQDRDGSGWYGTKTTRQHLGAALNTAGLACTTDADAVSSGMLKAHHLVDHICITADLAHDAHVSCWEPVDAAGQRLSDHPVVVVDLPSLTLEPAMGTPATRAAA